MFTSELVVAIAFATLSPSSVVWHLLKQHLLTLVTVLAEYIALPVKEEVILKNRDSMTSSVPPSQVMALLSMFVNLHLTNLDEFPLEYTTPERKRSNEQNDAEIGVWNETGEKKRQNLDPVSVNDEIEFTSGDSPYE